MMEGEGGEREREEGKHTEAEVLTRVVTKELVTKRGSTFSYSHTVESAISMSWSASRPV